MNNRYLKPIDAIESKLNGEGEGFAISAIICSLIEALETFRQGKVWKGRPKKGVHYDDTKYYGKQSEAIFNSFLTHRDPFKAHFAADNLACDFYENVRCALLHEAATRGGWKIRINTSALVERRDREFILNRKLLVQAIRQYMALYKVELSKNADLKKAYVQKMDLICELAIHDSQVSLGPGDGLR